MAPADPADGVRQAAPAKLNLYLHLLGRRADGYHLIDSLVAFAGVGDVVEVSPGEGLSLEVAGRFAAALAGTPENLVLRAARRLAAEGGVAADAAIRLHKALPVAAGLGGGSADAAAALRALAALWRLDPDEGDLRRLGAELGADVPACLAGRAVFVGGIGEAIEPAPALPPVFAVLARPPTPLATKDVYAAFAGAFSQPARFAGAPRDARELAARLAERANDLEAPARRLAPVVGETLAALAAEPGCLLARMCGSGAACLGLFATAGEASSAAGRIAAARPGWWVVSTALADQSARTSSGAATR